MEISPIAYYHCAIEGKFGLPRQSGLTPSLLGTICLEPQYARAEALRGLDAFDFIHLIWGFSLNHTEAGSVSVPESIGNKKSSPEQIRCQPTSLTVRPPRLGGNTRVGVFASRSPFRPNGLGLSSVKIESIDFDRAEITVSGADLADGTPIYDIKPYVEYADSHPNVRSGFVDSTQWDTLQIKEDEKARKYLLERMSEEQMQGLFELLIQDPRPQYHSDPDRTYALVYCGLDVHFRVREGMVEILLPVIQEEGN